MGRIAIANVLLVGGGYEYLRMLVGLGYGGATNVEEADIVLFTGGEDVSPELYDEKALEQTNSNMERDRFEMKVYHQAVAKGIPMVGICRGGQFLNVMNGGKMWQHVDGHGGTHYALRTEASKKHNKPQGMNVTSTHHQMMRPTEDAVVLLVATRSKERHAFGLSETGFPHLQHNPDTEVCWYPKTNSLCFQPHPEHGNAPIECLQFFEECMDNYVLPAIPLSDEMKAFLAKGATK